MLQARFNSRVAKPTNYKTDGQSDGNRV